MTRHGKRNRWIAAVAVGLLVLPAILLAYGLHGWAWSIYIPIYKGLLDAIPTPPGLVSESVNTTLVAYHPCGSRSYDVDNEHIAVVRFLAEELARADWELMERDSPKFEVGAETYERRGYKYRQLDRMVFVNRRQYWLGLEVETLLDAEGIQFDDPRVHMIVCEESQSYYAQKMVP